MITIITSHGKPALFLQVAKRTKVVILPEPTEEFEATLEQAHLLHQQWVAQETPNLVDALFKAGVPQHIYLNNNALTLRLVSNPLTGETFDKAVTATASINKFGLHRAFEVVWSKLVLKLGLLENSLVYPLKGAAFNYFKMKRIYK